MIMSDDYLEFGGFVFVLLIVCFIIAIPTIATVVVGIWLANMLGLTGIVWWSFVILFWMIVSSILSVLSSVN